MDKKKLPYIIVLTVLLSLLIKVIFFPSEEDRVKAQLAFISKILSFERTLAPLKILSIINQLKENITKDFHVDLSEFIQSSEHIIQRETIESLAPTYFRVLKEINIMANNVEKISPLYYRMVVITKGQSEHKKFNDAYRIEILFNKKLQMTKIKVLPPPEINSQ